MRRLGQQKPEPRACGESRYPNATPRLLCGNRESRAKGDKLAINTMARFRSCCLQVKPTLASDVSPYLKTSELTIDTMLRFWPRRQQLQPRVTSDVCLHSRNSARIFRGGVRTLQRDRSFPRPTPPPRFANRISGDVPYRRLCGYFTATLSVAPSRLARGAATARRGKAASSPLPLPPGRRSGHSSPSRP